MDGATQRKASLRGDAGPHKAAEPELDMESELEEAPELEEDPTWVETAEDGSVTIQLSKPLAPYHGKGADMFLGVKKITLREIYAGDMIAMDAEGGDMAKITSLAKELSKLPSAFIQRLHWEDFARVHGVINVKLGKFLGTSAQQWRR